MKVVFVQPRVGYRGVSYWEALGIGYIISYLKASGFSGEIEFFSGAFDSDSDIIKGCADADFVGFGCTSPQMKHALYLAKKIKEKNPECKTFFGGYHPSAQPIQTACFQEVDYVIVGEGEEGTLRLIYGEHENFPIIMSKPIENLDTLPWPDRDAIKVERHINLAYEENGERITSIQGSRGCPFKCIFCSNHIIHGRYVRRRHPKLLVDEIEYVVYKYNIDLLKFCDAEINSSIEWVKKLCREIMERDIDVEFEANVHAALVDREMLRLMKDAGFRQIDIGVESGSPRILTSIKKGITIDMVKRVFRWAKEVGLKRRAYFMVGFPGETYEDVELTFKLAEEIEADVYGMTILCPYPGTELYSPMLYAGVDWSTADEYGNDFYRTENFTNEELKAIQEKFMETFKDKLCYRLKRCGLSP